MQVRATQSLFLKLAFVLFVATFVGLNLRPAKNKMLLRPEARVMPVADKPVQDVTISNVAWQQLLTDFHSHIEDPGARNDMVLPVIVRQKDILCRKEHADGLQSNERFQAFFEMMHKALNFADAVRFSLERFDSNSSKTQTTKVHRRLQLPLLTGNRSIPLLMHIADEVPCDQQMFPRFGWCTAAENETCTVTAIPTFGLYQTMPEVSPEEHQFHWDLEQKYPWSSKLRQAVWRGVPTGRTAHGWASLHRARLVNFSIYHPDLFDGGFVHSGLFAQWYPEEEPKLRNFSRFANWMDLNDFQKYRAIVDIDGNSWSSRFGTLLCKNSVVIKVYPLNKNYFFDQLVPWRHYIPVKNDMSDFVEAVRFAVSDENEQKVKEIIYHANEFCRTHLTKQQFIRDMFWMIHDYIQELGNNATRWNQWQVQSNFYETNLTLVLR